MFEQRNRKALTHRRHLRIRKKVQGTAERPRLAVYRSDKHIYAQLIDDVAAQTLASAGTVESDLQKALKTKAGANTAAAELIGKTIAERAKSKGIESVVFDRGGNLYTGRIQALADAAREAGLVF